MAKALGIPLGIDFAKIDRDLNMVADRIEQMGKTVKLGVDMGDSSGGGAGVDISGLADRFASGIAGGIRSSSSLMIAFATRFESIFDRVGGAAITIFERIDTAIKFPQFRAMLDKMSAKLMNFAMDGKKGLTQMQLAAEGAFGPTAQVIAKMASEMNLVNANIGRSEASAKMLFQTMESTAKATQRFNMGTAGYKGVVPGPKIGNATQFTAPAPAELTGLAAVAKKVGSDIKTYLSDPRILENARADVARMRAALEYLDRLPARIGAGFAAMSINTYTSLKRIGNFMSSIGPVTKKTFSDMFNSMVRISTLGFMPNAVESVKGFNTSLTSSNSLVGKLTGSVMGLGAALLAAFGAAGIIYKAGQFIKDSVNHAKDLSAAVERSKVVFGSSFGVVEEQATNLNKQYKILKQDQLELAAGFGAIAQGAGMSEEASAGFANQMTIIAAEMVASNEAATLAEAGDAITSGLTGRGMALKQLGAVMDEDAVAAYSLATGVRKSGEEMGRLDTLATRAALITRGLTTMQGSLERNTGTAADAFRRAGGGIDTFSTQLGSLLMPAILSLTGAFNTLMGATLTFFETNKAAIAGWADTIKQKIEFVGVIVRNLDVVWEMTTLQFGMQVENIIRYVQTLGPNFSLVFGWLKRNWLNLYTDMTAIAGAFFVNLLKNAANFGMALWDAIQGKGFNFEFTGLLDGFKATTEALPEMIKPALVDVDGQMKELGDKIAAREADRLAGMKAAGAAPGKPGALPELDKDKKGADYKLSSAMETNSKEAASVIARSQTAGVGKGDAAKEHLKVAKDSKSTLESINNKLGGGAVKLAIK